MANMTIEQYTQVINLGGNEFLLISQDGVYKKVTLDQIRNLATDISNTELATLAGKAASAQDVKNILNTINSSLSAKAKQSDLAQLSNPNLIINGAIQVWQRGTSFTLNANDVKYTADRFKIWNNGSASLTVIKVDTGLQLISTSSKVVYYTFEDIDLQKIKNKVLTLSIKIDNVVYSRTFTHAGDTTWRRIDFFNANVSVEYTGGEFTISFASGSYIINNIKLEIGDKATPFVPRLVGEELALCQRYYFKTPYQKLVRMSFYTPNGIFFDLPLPVDMRITPTLVGTANTDYAVNTITAGAPTGFAFSIGKTSGGVSIGANKTAHGLTDAIFVLSSNSGLDAEIY